VVLKIFFYLSVLIYIYIYIVIPWFYIERVVYKDDLSVNSHIETELYYNGFKKNFKLIGTFGRITQI